MHTTATVIREISFQLTQGNPWWGMLLANEYIPERNPLRAAFVLRFKHSIGAAPTGRGTLANALIRGKRRSELSASQLASVGARTVRAVRSTTARKSAAWTPARTPGLAHRVGVPQRLAARQRNSHVARFRSCALLTTTCTDVATTTQHSAVKRAV